MNAGDAFPVDDHDATSVAGAAPPTNAAEASRGAVQARHRLGFEVLAVDPQTGARRGRLWTAHGPVETPAFMPVGTNATVKAMAPWELEQLGAQVILANA